MNENKTMFKIALGALVALCVVAALWRVMVYEADMNLARSSKKPQAGGQAQANQAPSAAAHVASQETLNELLPDESASAASRPENAAKTAEELPAAPAQPVDDSNNRASDKKIYTEQPTTQEVRETNPSNTAQQQPAVQVTTPSYNGGQSSARVNFPQTASERIQEERAHMLAPYLRPNRKEKEQMNAKWARLSAAIDRAVLQALTPKSKKEQMLEKYGHKSAQKSNVTDDAFSAITNAVAEQKQDLVKSFGAAFGAAAAQQAGSLMDSFAGEVSAALSAPGADAQQTARQVKEITKKYQKEMDKLAEKSQYDKFVADRQAYDAQQKQELASLYNDAELSAKFNQIIDATREKDLALALQNLPREEYATQVAQNNQEMRNQLRQAITAAGQSVNPYYGLEQDQAQMQVEEIKSKVESGEIESVARVASADETIRMKKDVAVQRQDIHQRLVQGFGEQVARDFDPILQEYENRLDQLYQQKLSPEEREAQRVSLLKDVNRQLLDKQIEQVETMNIPDEYKQKALADLREAYNNLR